MTSTSTPAADAKRHEEHQYLDLISHILTDGERRQDRTGTGTYSVFGPPQLRFSLSRPGPTADAEPELVLPLLTTKRVFLRAVVAELLWFISGDTSADTLSTQGVRIWDGNGSREFLDSVGLGHREPGDLGPVYGFQWRHFGAEYTDRHADYAGQGVDQLADVVHKLIHNPYDRRIILSAWNPADLAKMALPPCHMFAQFYVSFPGGVRQVDEGEEGEDGKGGSVEKNKKRKGVLHCQLYQRSCDMGLGVPFNIASYALLTHMLAHACGLIPGTFIHAMGDAHVYANHEEALREQLTREPREFPTLQINRQDGGQGIIDGWTPDDFTVVGYNPHKLIAMKMAV